jgi:hypothetical protein
LKAKVTEADEQRAAFRELLIPRTFSEVPLAGFILPIIVACVALAVLLGLNASAYLIAGAAVVILVGGCLAMHRAGFTLARPAAESLAATLAEARRLHGACAAAAERTYEADRQRLQADFDRTSEELNAQWSRSDDIEAEFEKTARDKLEAQVPRIGAKIDVAAEPKLARLQQEGAARLQHLQASAQERISAARTRGNSESAQLEAEEQEKWQQLTTEWQQAIVPLYQELESMRATAMQRFPSWSPELVQSWSPAQQFTAATKFAELRMNLAAGDDLLLEESRLTLPASPEISLPVALTFPDRGSLLIETNESAGPAVVGALNNIILRLLATTPPGKITFTIIDPVGLGQSFAGLMHLADHEESLINRRIWTQRDQIEERLAELSEHIEKVIQMYLRNEYATITEYNEQAGSVAEKYHFLVIADFPANFSESAIKRLQSIAASGARCGIFTLIHWDLRHLQPDGLVPDDLRKNSVALRAKGGEFVVSKEQVESGARLVLDAAPEPELAVELVHKIGRSSVDSNRVEVPFSQITPAPEEFWAGDTTGELRIPIGRTGATKHQYLAIGKGTRQHALFAGKTGSGKSTLFHVIITNLALACSPEQVEFYLIDFKKGVEFKCYATKRLPHARVVAIESDREFALSVLQRVDEELKRRGDLFRQLGVQDIAGYKKAGGTEAIPRTLLIIDEFQEFFVEDDTVAQMASLLFDRIVRQGRAFGIHVLLGSQSLGGAYSLARATLGQMVIRVALQCNEADAYLIMDDNNAAPRLLSRPGEGIYNDAGGAVEGNSPFQVVWLPDDERDEWLDRVRSLAVTNGERRSSPIVFEGNSPADIQENDQLATLLDSTPSTPPLAPKVWLGAPNSIKGPTEAVFRRQSGNHLLIIGQREEAAVTLVGMSLMALAAQYPVGGVRLVLLHVAAPGSSDAELLDRVLAAIPHNVTVIRSQEVGDVMTELAGELKVRTAGEQSSDAPPVFLFIHGLHRFKKLRQEDDFSFSSEPAASAGAQLNELISEGSSNGIHLVVTIDTFNNVNRFMSRKALTEFEMRVVFQMSANDSASLIDSPRASNLGLHRALLYNEHEGSLETFRPYATPNAQWLAQAGEKMKRRAVTAG